LRPRVAARWAPPGSSPARRSSRRSSRRTSRSSTGTALEQHVPMGARRLARLLVRTVGGNLERLGAAAGAVPQRRHLGLDREGHLEPVTARAVVGHGLPVRELDAALVLVAGGAKARATERGTLGHRVSPSGDGGPFDRRSVPADTGRPPRFDMKRTSQPPPLFRSQVTRSLRVRDVCHALRTLAVRGTIDARTTSAQTGRTRRRCGG